MRTTLKHTLAACIALGALMLSGTACTQDDPLGGNNPAGTQLLQLGKVTIAGAETATRSADAATRADIDADATTGFTGIRKHAFVKDDELVLTLTSPAGTGGSGTPVEVTATLDGTTNTWTLPTKTYFTPGTTIDARYTPATGKQPGGIRYSDDLVATNQKPLADGTPLALTLTHANAMVEVTPPAGITGYENLTVSATPPAPAGGGAATTELLATNKEGTDTDLRHRTITPAGATLNSISLTVNTVVYTAPIDPPVQVAANKRYPITLKMSAEEGLTATVAEGTNWGVGGDVNGYPTGYRYISTAADLVKLAADVNAGTATTATALQTADIDMKDVTNWVPIGNATARSFKGSYNGNGYSIDKLTIDDTYTNGIHYLGLFGFIEGAKITGVHLRDCNLKGSGGADIYAGALAAYASSGCIVTLCSATGKIEATANYTYAAGLVAYNPQATQHTEETINHYTRCNVDVDVTTNATTSGYTCAFTGYSVNVNAAGCIASGTVTANNNTGAYSGFGYSNGDFYPYRAIGCITNSEITNDVKIGFGRINTVLSCLATQPSYNYFCAETTTVTDNVSLGRHTSTNITNPVGVSIEVSAADAYGLLTTNNVASPIKMRTLHYSPTDGYTLNVVEQYWYAKGIWKDNGNERPTIDMGYEGGAVPEPITPGNKVYRVNGYWVTAPEADETTKYQWNSNTGSDTMEKDLCAGTGKGWLMPTMKDFEAMAGWETDYPWSQAAGAGDAYLRDVADADAFFAAFPVDGTDGNYWSSDPKSGSIAIWVLISRNTPPQASYSHSGKANRYRIRCVQKQAFPTP